MAVTQEDQRTKTVKQSTIDAIRQMGMSKAIAKYTAGEGGAEFRTAVERYYSPQRLKAASRKATQGQVAKPGTPPAAPSTPVSSAPAPSQAAISRRLEPKGMAQALGAPIPQPKPSAPKKPSAYEAAVTASTQTQSPGSGRFGGPNPPPPPPPKPKKPPKPPAKPSPWTSLGGAGMGRSSH